MDDSEKLDLIYNAFRDYTHLHPDLWFKEGSSYFQKRFKDGKELLFFSVEDSTLIIGKKVKLEYGQTFDILHVSDRVISLPNYLYEEDLRLLTTLSIRLIREYYSEFV